MTYETLIQRLFEHWGMGYGAVAKAAELPVSRIRRWYLHGDDDITEQTITKLQLLDQWMDQAKRLGAEEPAGTLDGKLVDGYTATGWDLYSNGEGEALLRIVAGAEAQGVLDGAFSDWRTRFDTAYEVFDADDGYKSIRVKDGYRAPRTY